jgi:uncharacterized SAM-binding protein YcdF (DUF218 family)
LIVLGARLTPEGRPGRVARLRLSHALHLWRHGGGGAYLILSGGFWPHTGCSEARAMADWALNRAAEHGGAEMRAALQSCLILEEVSRSTAASARHTLPLVQGRGWRRVGLVTDAVHIHRALFLFRRQFAPDGIIITPLPARGLVRHYLKQRRYLWLGKMALREGGAWLKLWARLALKRG